LTFTLSGSKEHIPKCRCKIKSMIENTYGRHDIGNMILKISKSLFC
jgi:hypothetical protein